MKIGILGGAFDPPHAGHLIVASQIREYLHLDEIWLMPVHDHPFRKSLSPASHRFTMTKLLETEYIRVSDFEIKRGHTSYTIETLEQLYKDRPDDFFYWCIGSDMLADFQKWHRWQELVSQYNLVIYPRGIGVIDLYQHVCKAFDYQTLPDHIYPLDQQDVVITNISSTLVRSRLKEKKSIEYIVPEKVINYILSNALYTKL